jgi:hypothetical protein
LTGLAEEKTLIETGEVACAAQSGPSALAVFLAEAFLILISVAVVEVPQSVQVWLYSGSRRPHFRQKGIGSLNF